MVKGDPRPRRQMRSGKLAEPSCGQPLPNTLRLNMEGLTQSKICVISQLATTLSALLIIQQETHCTTPNQLVTPNFKLAGWTMSRKHGLEGLDCALADESFVEWLCVDVDGVKIVNLYKSPTSRMTSSAIPVFPHPCHYAGDFNCPHLGWGDSTTSPDGESLDDWGTKSILLCCSILKTVPASSLDAGTSVPTHN